MTSATPSDIQHGRIELGAPPSNTSRAWHDLVAGLGKSWLWMELAKQDMRLRYRGSMLGPFWLTLSTIIMISSMGFLYAKLFRQDVAAYFPFLTVGLVVWNFLAAAITEGTGTFTAVQSIIQQVPLPYSVHAYRLVYRNILVLAHNFVIVPIVFFFFDVSIGWRVLWLVPAILILTMNCIWCSILLGMVSARFRDVPPIVSSLVTVVFFVTPIMWSSSALGDWQRLGELNPLFAAIDVVRAPLLGVALSSNSWPVLLATTAVGCAGTFAVFVRFRSRIAFWV